MFAARITDMHVCPLVNGIVPHVGGPIITPVVGQGLVLIGGLPAAGQNSMCTCVGPPDMVGPIIGRTVMIGGMPLARMGDMTNHGGSIILGCFTVTVQAGMANMGAISGMANQAMAAAAETASTIESTMEDVKDAAARLEQLNEGGVSDSESSEFNNLSDDYGDTIAALGL